jgi:hypothetical protein
MDLPSSSVLLTVGELRSALLDMGESEETVASLKKAQLVELYDKKSQGDETFSIAFEEDDDEPSTLTIGEALPEYGSKAWQSYIMGLLEPNEQIDGYPRCFGLRRIAQKLLGPIISSRVNVLSVIPTADSRAVTISYEVTFDWQLNTPMVVGAMVPPDYRVFGGVADCIENPDSVFGRHPAASAETKAESRALKKALCLNVLSAEEKTSGYDESIKEESPRKVLDENHPLVTCLRAKSEMLKVNLDDLIKEQGLSGPLESLSVQNARDLFIKLNSYQQS